MALFSIFRPAPEKVAATALYGAVVAQSRRPEFYSQLEVEDSVDGRFDLLALHAGLVMRRLTPVGGRAGVVSQQLMEIMFRDLDHALREMGVGDLTVPKRMKDMGEAFYGRSRAYDRALVAGDVPGLTQAIIRNVYRGQERPKVHMLARYVVLVAEGLSAQSDDDLTDGRVSFPDLEAVS